MHNPPSKMKSPPIEGQKRSEVYDGKSRRVALTFPLKVRGDGIRIAASRALPIANVDTSDIRNILEK